jgi:hypothetical protein
MNAFKYFYLALLIILIYNSSLKAWTSSNEGVCYTMDTLTALSPNIVFNPGAGMYEITTNIIILENDTLKILPGEILKFLDNNNVYRGIKIYGCLISIGNPDSKIILGDPMYNISSGSVWNGIKFYNTSNLSILQNCIIRGATDHDGSGAAYGSAIYCENSSPIIDHCIICYMITGDDTGGGSAISCRWQSYPIISYCRFEHLINSIAIWCNPWSGSPDTINYPSPLIYGCNVMTSSVTGFWFNDSINYNVLIFNGGFLDNCYLGADTTLGFPSDTTGDGICNTTSTYWMQRFMNVDGVVNPRGDTLLTGISEKEIGILPTTTNFLILKNNYPNPFSGFTTIEFEVKSNTAPVSLEIFDSKGNKVRDLISSKKYNAGKYTIDWHGENDSGHKADAGIYFYKLTSGDKMLVKKAIVVK